MAWIKTIPEGDAEGPLADLYEKWTDPDGGRVDNILKVHSLHPAGLEGHLALYEAVMKGTPTLRKVERELIAVVVSTINHCHY